MALIDHIKIPPYLDDRTKTLATSATDAKTYSATVATVATVSVTTVEKLTPRERAELLNYVDAIGETDPEEITYFLNQCETDQIARRWFLDSAAKVSLFRKP